MTLAENENATFKPQINKKSKELSSNVDKIENRIGQLKQEKLKKIELISSQNRPSFTPRINLNTDKLLEEGKKRVFSNSPLQPTRSSSVHDFIRPVREQ